MRELTHLQMRFQSKLAEILIMGEFSRVVDRAPRKLGQLCHHVKYSQKARL